MRNFDKGCAKMGDVPHEDRPEFVNSLAKPSRRPRDGSADSLKGLVLGGGQPITNSTVTLWAASAGEPTQLSSRPRGKGSVRRTAASNRGQARARRSCAIVRAADAVHFRDSPTSTHNRDSIHSEENSDIGSERVVESMYLRW